MVGAGSGLPYWVTTRGVVDLEDEAGVDDGAVLLAHGLGDGGEELLLGGVVTVPTLQLDGAGGDGRDEGFFRERSAARPS